MIKQPENISSPPCTPPANKETPSKLVQGQISAYSDVEMSDSLNMDQACAEYIDRSKTSFEQLNRRQRRLFLEEILSSCDNQLLQYIHTFITPKLKMDFIQAMPMELAIHVFSFIDHPRTLAQASQVSHLWNTLLKDEGVWKSLCFKHNYHPTQFFHTIDSDDPEKTSFSYREFFRRKYNIDTAWIQGCKVKVCKNQIGEGLATSIEMDSKYMVVGCDNNRVEVYDSKTGRQLRSLIGHDGGVWALQFIINKDNHHILVTGGCDRVARVWNLNTGELKYILRGHNSTIRCLKMNKKIVVTGSRDTTLRIWDVEKGRLKYVCVGHHGSVRCLDMHGSKVASGSYDLTARLWDVNSGECLHEFIGHQSQIYTIVYDGYRVATGSLDSSIKIWSPFTGDCLGTLQGHTSLVGHLKLSNHRLVSGGSDGCLRIWNLSNFECVQRISAHDNSVTCLEFDSNHIISGGSDGKVKIWDIHTGSLIRPFTSDARTVWKLQLTETKAVVVLQRNRQMVDVDELPYQAVIELHDFDFIP